MDPWSQTKDGSREEETMETASLVIKTQKSAENAQKLLNLNLKEGSGAERAKSEGRARVEN